MPEPRTYVGLDHDIKGGMTDTGKIIRDAQAFGLIAESATCAGWTAARLEALWEQADTRWASYGFSVAALPEDIRARFLALHGAALARAKAAGWSGAGELDDDG